MGSRPVPASQLEASLDSVPEPVTRSQLVSYFETHNPSNVANVDAILREFSGKDGELRQGLKDKYGADLN